MDLSPEERRKIYEEEKARIEEEEKQAKEGASSTNLEPDVAGLLCYLGLWITGIVFILIEQKNRFVRFHAIQSIIVFGALAVASIVLNQIPWINWFFGVIIGITTFILWIVLMVKAYHGELYKVSLAGDLAERISGVSYGREVIEKRGEPSETQRPSEPPSALPARDSGKQASHMTGRVGRITSSGFAIAWSFVLLIFFNFFHQYIAYYQLEKIDGVTEWVGYPVLTGAFAAWLPILNVTLLLSVVGNIILIIFDKYVLRETTLIILNLFGIAVISTLLSIFPFDFSLIPNADLADISPLMATVVLVGIIVGLGIATLVGFIKLIVNVAMRSTSY